MFLQEIDINRPDLIIDLGTLNDSSQIYHRMRKIKATHFVYAFYWRPSPLEAAVLVQIGESAPADVTVEDNILGERIVRKAANLSGWKQIKISSHGIELQRSLELAHQHGIIPHVPTRNEIIVAVWNLNSREVTNLASKREQSRWAEGELTRQYKQLHNGKTPICNIIDCESNTAYKKGYVNLDAWINLFDEG